MVDEALGVEGLAAPGQLLSLTSNQALEVGFAEGQAASLDDLIGELGLGGALVRTLDATWAENLVRFLTNPLVAPVLLSLGMLGAISQIKEGAFGCGGC